MRGFSLIELLVTLGIAGVLSGIALPSYHHTLQRAQRQDARLALLRIQHFQERHFAEHLRYAGRLPAPAGAESLGLDVLSDAGSYELSVQADAAGLGYTALARVHGRQSGDRDCAVLTLDQSGRRGSEDAGGNRLLPDTGRCWN
ncbi:MAG: hypothetical protein RL030_833 [Pseudomonadota bacterium]